MEKFIHQTMHFLNLFYAQCMFQEKEKSQPNNFVETHCIYTGRVYDITFIHNNLIQLDTYNHKTQTDRKKTTALCKNICVSFLSILTLMSVLFYICIKGIQDKKKSRRNNITTNETNEQYDTMVTNTFYVHTKRSAAKCMCNVDIT